MPQRVRLFSNLLLLTAFLTASPTHAEQERPPVKYKIVDKDSLWVIATLFYNAPSAGITLYNINKAVLDAANKHHQKGAHWIFPDTVIELPAEIRSRGIPYRRRDFPMNRSLALAIGHEDGIDMTGLVTITREQILPKDTELKKTMPPPFDQHAPVSSGPKAIRESAPAWFKEPDSHLETCAKAVCNRFKQLCFFECLAVAKRLADGEHQTTCDTLVQLPYEVDEETRENCAELVK